MKRTFVIILIILMLFLASCSGPAEGGASDDSRASPQTSEPPAETEYSAEELRELIARHKASGDDQALYETALKLLAFNPSDTDAYLVALDALANMSKTHFEEIDRLLAQSGENAGDLQAIAEWVSQNQPDYSFCMPFVPDYTSEDEINTEGISIGNMTNGAKYQSYNGWWVGGLLTWQGDWVYLSRPDENFAIYKMRADGSEYQRVGEECGSCLNVIGDWIFFANHRDGSKAYKMRTDGSLLTKLVDDDCEFLSVSGGWMFYHNGDDGGCLYRVKTDGSEKEKLVDTVVMFPCVYEGYIYYTEKSEGASLYRIPADGGEPEIVIDSASQAYSYKDENGAETTMDLTTDLIQTCCVWDDWIYYFDVNHPYSIRRVHTDGTGYEMVWLFDFSVSTLNIAGDHLICSFWEKDHYEEDGYVTGEEIVFLDLEPLDEKFHIVADTEPVCTGPNGWAYYYKYSEGQAWYAVNIDGTEYKVG